MEDRYLSTAKILKAISDPKRLRIVDMLSCGELCGSNILEFFKVSQPTLSHDMKVLVQSGIVEERRHGKNIFYSLNKANIDAFHKGLLDITTSSADCICHRMDGTANTDATATADAKASVATATAASSLQSSPSANDADNIGSDSAANSTAGANNSTKDNCCCQGCC